MREIFHHRKVVRDEQVAQVQFLLQVTSAGSISAPAPTRPARWSARRRSAVCGDHRQRARDRDALALPAGKLVRITPLGSLRQARPVPAIHRCAAAAPHCCPSIFSASMPSCENFRHAHFRVQRGIGILEHHLHPGALLRRLTYQADQSSVRQSARCRPWAGISCSSALPSRGLAAARFAHQRQGASLRRYPATRHPPL